MYLSPVFLPEFMRLLAAALRALPHACALCSGEGAARVNHRLGGARSSTANSFGFTTPSSCSAFLSHYDRVQSFPVAFLNFELHLILNEFAFSRKDTGNVAAKIRF